MDETQFDAKRALEALTDEGVRFVLIGGLAANMHGSHHVTLDVDICYARDRVNLERLANALRALHARLRGAPPDVPFLLDAHTLEAGDSFTFSTDAGPLDCLATPSGTTGFAALDANAVEAQLHGMKIRVTALDDLIRMKRAAGRPKDRVMLEELGALREETEGRGREG